MTSGEVREGRKEGRGAVKEEGEGNGGGGGGGGG